MRRALRVLAAFALVAALAYGAAVAYFVGQIRTYPVLTHEAAFAEPALVAEFGLGGRRTPAAFGFPAYREEPYRSAPSGLRLGGWYVPARDTASRRAVVFVHGRPDNRLKALKYLPLVRAAGLDSTHAAFLPDLRNSGTSAPGNVDMGLGFADDLASTLEHLARRHGTRRVTVYAFSMGALATAMMLHRPDLRARLARAGVAVERVVMDSPLADAPGVLRLNAAQQGLPGALTGGAVAAFDRTAAGGYLDSMRLGVLLRAVRVPVLIVQGGADTATPLRYLRAEQPRFPPNVRVEVFAGADHVKIVNHPRVAGAYARVVTDFLRRRPAAPAPAQPPPARGVLPAAPPSR